MIALVMGTALVVVSSMSWVARQKDEKARNELHLIIEESERNHYLINVAPGLRSEQVTMKKWIARDFDKAVGYGPELQNGAEDVNALRR